MRQDSFSDDRQSGLVSRESILMNMNRLIAASYDREAGGSGPNRGSLPEDMGLPKWRLSP